MSAPIHFEGKVKTEPMPEELALIRRIGSFIRMRWGAALGVAIVATVAGRMLGIRFDSLPVYLGAAGIAGYNIAFWLADKRLARSSAPDIARVRRFINVQIEADLLALTTLLYFTGGIQNPFIIYYTFHIIIASILLSERTAFLHTAQVLVLLVLLYALGLGGHMPLAPYWREHYILALLFVFCTLVTFTTYLTTSIGGELRKRQRELASLSADLSEKTDELERTNERLVRLDRLRTHFLAVASHDLQTPMVAVDGYLQAVLGGFVGPLTEPQRTMLSRCSQRIQAQLEMVKDLLNVSTIQSGQIARQMGDVVLSKVIENALENVLTAGAQKSVALNSHVSAEIAPIWGSSVHLEEVLNNLLSNAVKYTPPGGHVSLRVRDGPAVLFEVIDDGMGVREEDVPRIFEGYFRSKDSIARGTGLGLMIAKEIVEAHGGRIWVESPYPLESGRGSRFAFILPRNVEAASGYDQHQIGNGEWPQEIGRAK